MWLDKNTFTRETPPQGKIEISPEMEKSITTLRKNIRDNKNGVINEDDFLKEFGFLFKNGFFYKNIKFVIRQVFSVSSTQDFWYNITIKRKNGSLVILRYYITEQLANPNYNSRIKLNTLQDDIGKKYENNTYFGVENQEDMYNHVAIILKEISENWILTLGQKIYLDEIFSYTNTVTKKRIQNYFDKFSNKTKQKMLDSGNIPKSIFSYFWVVVRIEQELD